MLDSRAIENLRRAAPSAFHDDGSLRPFDEQMVSYEMGELPPEEILVVSLRAHTAGLPEIDDLPITIDQSTVEKVKTQHGLRPADVKNLAFWIKEHPFAMDSLSMENSVFVCVDATDRQNHHIIVPVHVAKEVGDIGHELVVDVVASIYRKRNLEYMISNTAKAGLKLFVNEKTKGWASRSGLQLPPLAPSHFISEYTLAPVRSSVALETLSKPGHFDDLVEAGWDPTTMFPKSIGPWRAVEVSEHMIGSLVEVWAAARDAGEPAPCCCRDLYFARCEDGSFLCVDNRQDECFVEQFQSSFEAKCWLSEGDLSLSELTQEELREAWSVLGDVAVDDDGRLDEKWLRYEEGTDREEVWHDFDAAYYGGVHALMFPGDHEKRGNPSLADSRSDASRGAPRGDERSRSTDGPGR